MSAADVSCGEVRGGDLEFRLRGAHSPGGTSRAALPGGRKPSPQECVRGGRPATAGRRAQSARTGLRPADQRLAAGQERPCPVRRPRGGAARTDPPGAALAARTRVRRTVRPRPVAAPVGAGGGRPGRRPSRGARDGGAAAPSGRGRGRSRWCVSLPGARSVPSAGRPVVLRPGAEQGRPHRPAPGSGADGRPGHARGRLGVGEVLPAERRRGARVAGRRPGRRARPGGDGAPAGAGSRSSRGADPPDS